MKVSIVALLCFGAVLFAPHCVQAQGTTTATTSGNFTNAGSTGGTYQSIWIGARGSGMAGAFTALSDDVTALYWNPAGIARLGNGINVGATYTRWFGGITDNFLGVVLPLSDKYRLGIAMTLVDYGDLRASSIAQDYNAGTFNANDMGLGITFAGALTDRFSFGLTARYTRDAIADMSSTGIAFDAGSLYQTDFYNMKISLALTNLGSDQSFTGNSLSISAPNPNINAVGRNLDLQLVSSSYPIPLSFVIGVATDVFQGKVENQKLNVALDFGTHSDGPQTFNLGGEYVWNDLLALRTGYSFNQDQLGFAGGLGVKYKSEDFNGNIDYSFTDTKNFGFIHRVSISAAFQ